jgi:hypothetical protein
MKEYGIVASFELVVLDKINDFLVKCLLKYIEFFKKYDCNEAFIATYNVIPKKSRLQRYVMERIFEQGKESYVPIFCQINNELFMTLDKEYYPREYFIRLKLPFPIWIIKRISLNEELNIGNYFEYALLGVAVCAILESVIYEVFCDMKIGPQEITKKHVVKCIEKLEKCL